MLQMGQFKEGVTIQIDFCKLIQRIKQIIAKNLDSPRIRLIFRIRILIYNVKLEEYHLAALRTPHPSTSCRWHLPQQPRSLLSNHKSCRH